MSSQSRAERKQELVQSIQQELSQFKWLISGSVQIEFAWYLHSIERQETDKVGDIDNITKPILDALTGPNGILIDDSQIGSVHTFWMSRNEQVTYSVLTLEIQFSNDDCLDKHNLVFIQYWNAMCIALNVDFTDQKSIFGALFVVRFRRWYRHMASRFRGAGADFDRALIQSTWDFHRTRVGGFPRECVLSTAQFKQRALDGGLSWANLRKLRQQLGKPPLLRMPALQPAATRPATGDAPQDRSAEAELPEAMAEPKKELL
ncbi:RusA family crossover junction endodeoxyribonuclease [Burkholderia cepacia]|uniref:RusA family crossover junction endodeoxyribonuclease n=1 Tax=Burkholderia cepacia TaxID=292 RepID=UPI001E5A23BA|nr:RusA family crossover junction endodeoxyribonuclease [Burkholderia cepacia]